MAKIIVRSGAAAPATVPARPRTRSAEPRAPEPAPAADPNSFVDGRGRAITVRRLSALDQMRLMRHIGEENAVYFSFCMDIARVSKIEGRSFSIPETRIDLEHVVQLLAVDGIDALRAHLHPPTTATVAADDAGQQ